MSHGETNGSGIFYLRSDATRYEVLHELSHTLDFRSGPAQWVNAASTPELGNLLREQAAFNRLYNSRSWLSLNPQEKLDAINYLNGLGGNTEVIGGRTVSKFRFGR